MIDDYLPNLTNQDLLCQSRGQGNSNAGPSPLRKELPNFSSLIERAIKLDQIVGVTDLVKNHRIAILS